MLNLDAFREMLFVGVCQLAGDDVTVQLVRSARLAQAHVCLVNTIGTRCLALPHESFPWDNRFVDDVEFALRALSAFET